MVSKSSGTRKTVKNRKITGNSRTKTSGTKKTSRKKAYISPVKVILFCGSVIVLCLFLLLITTIMQPVDSDVKNVNPVVTVNVPEKKSDTQKNVTSPKEDSSKTDVKKSESKKTQNVTAKTPDKAAAKTDSSKQKSKTENAKPAEKDSASSKTTVPQKKSESTAAAPKPAEKPVTVQSSAPSSVSSYNFTEAKNNAVLVFLFDDGGQNLSQLDKFLKLPFPVTIAVLPQLAHSVEAADKIRQSGNEVMLHQPMQSVSSSINPGPGAIKPGMTENQITSILFQNINQIGPIAGLNNHEGSLVTADADMMAVVLKVCSEEGIFFLDSRTNAETKVPYVAGELGYTYYERNIFLDNVKTRENALAELKKGLEIANKSGSAIMIGHVWSADFLPDFLKEVYPELKAKGYTFKTVSKSQRNGRK